MAGRRTCPGRPQPARERAGMAILTVLLVLLALLVLCAPFLMTARNASRASGQLADGAQVRLALDSAAREARTQLARSHPSVDLTPWSDDEEELRLGAELDSGVLNSADARGVMWDAEVLDVAGRLDINSAPPQVFANLLGASTRLNKALAAADKQIEVQSTAGFPDVGFVWIGRELIGYAEKDGQSFKRLQRGLGASFDADGNPMPCGPQVAGDHAPGEPVVDQRAFAPVIWRSFAGGGVLRAFDAPEHVREAARHALSGLDEAALAALESGGSVYAGLRGGPTWQHGARVIAGLIGGESCDLALDDNRWFNPGTTVEISDGETTELGLVVASTARGVRLLYPVVNDYLELSAVLRPLARRPVNANTASPQTLEVLFANLQLAGVNSRITGSEARELAALVVESRPFTGFEDFLRRVVLPAAGLEALPEDAPVTPAALATAGELASSGAGGGLISTDDAVALFANALNANDSRLLVSTLPLCFTTRDVYQLDLRASVNAASGVERGAGRREQVEVIVPQEDPLLVAWGRQEDFEEALRLGREARHWSTGPSAVGIGGDRSSPASRVRANMGAWANSRYVQGIEPYQPVPAGAAGSGAAGASESVEYVFADREEGAWAQLEVSREDESGRRAGRVLHFDYETRDPEGRFLPDEPLRMATWDQRVRWVPQPGELLRALDLSLWFKPAVLADGVLLDVGDSSLDTDRVTLELEGGDLVLRVRDAGGDHPDTQFDEIGEARYSIQPGGPFGGAGIAANTWTHVSLDVRGTRPDQITLLVDGQAHGVRTLGRTRLTSPLLDGAVTFQVDNDEGFPERGVVRIGKELIEYTRAGKTFSCARFSSGPSAGFGGRMARVDYELGSTGVEPGAPTVLTSSAYDTNHEVGTPVQLYGYSLQLAGDVSPGNGLLSTDIGPFAVGVIESVVDAQQQIGDPIALDGLIGAPTIGFGLGGANSQATGLVLRSPDAGLSQADVLSAFSTAGGYAALIQRIPGPVNGGAAGTTTTFLTPEADPIFGVEIIRYSGRDGTTLFIAPGGRAALPTGPNLPQVPHAFIVQYQNVTFGGVDGNLILERSTFVVPISLPVGGVQGQFGFPSNASGSEYAQITHTTDAEHTEWVRYDRVETDQLVRSDPLALEALALALTHGTGGTGDFTPPPGTGSGTGQTDGQGGPNQKSGEAGALAPASAPAAPQQAQGTGGSDWLPFMPDPALVPDAQHVVTYAARTAFQFRGVAGTFSQAHSSGLRVLPAFRVLRLPSELPEAGMPGRHDSAFLFTGSRTNLGSAVQVHRAYRPNQYLVASWTDNGANQLEPIAGATSVAAEDPWLRGFTWVALEEATLPVPIGSTTGNATSWETRDQARLVMHPSGERPREATSVSIGGTLRGASVPPALVDEIVFGDTHVGDGTGDPATQGGQFQLASNLPPGSLSFTVEPQGLRVAAGIYFSTTYFLSSLPSDAGLLRIGSEIVCYSSLDASSGTVQIPQGGRALLGTVEENHEVGETATFLDAWTVSTLGSGISGGEANLLVADSSDFPAGGGTVRIGDELLHYSTLSGAALTMPRLSVEPGRMDRRGSGLFRGRFGTTPAVQNAGAPVILHPFRYWDRWADRADAPELAYFGFSVDQPNAFWRSAFFEAEEPSSGAAHIEVLQRVTQYLGQAPVPWDADPREARDLSLLEQGFREGQGHAIGTQADRVEWRVFVRYTAGAFDPAAGASHGWKQTPRLRLLGAEFLAPDLVLRRVER